MVVVLLHIDIFVVLYSLYELLTDSVSCFLMLVDWLICIFPCCAW
jgi:hypothetical protein